MPEERIRDFSDLLAWQQAIELAVLCDEICDRLPRKAWHLSSQMRRAATSVHSNIAEGNGRFSLADYLRHLSMANASLRELQSDLFFLSRKNASDLPARKALEQSHIVAKLLMKLVQSLRRKRDEGAT